MTNSHTSRRSMLRGLALSPDAATAGAGTGLLTRGGASGEAEDSDLEPSLGTPNVASSNEVRN